MTSVARASRCGMLYALASPANPANAATLLNSSSTTAKNPSLAEVLNAQTTWYGLFNLNLIRMQHDATSNQLTFSVLDPEMIEKNGNDESVFSQARAKMPWIDHPERLSNKKVESPGANVWLTVNVDALDNKWDDVCSVDSAVQSQHGATQGAKQTQGDVTVRMTGDLQDCSKVLGNGSMTLGNQFRVLSLQGDGSGNATNVVAPRAAATRGPHIAVQLAAAWGDKTTPVHLFAVPHVAASPGSPSQPDAEVQGSWFRDFITQNTRVNFKPDREDEQPLKRRFEAGELFPDSGKNHNYRTYDGQGSFGFKELIIEVPDCAAAVITNGSKELVFQNGTAVGERRPERNVACREGGGALVVNALATSGKGFTCVDALHQTESATSSGRRPIMPLTQACVNAVRRFATGPFLAEHGLQQDPDIYTVPVQSSALEMFRLVVGNSPPLREQFLSILEW